MRGMIGAVRSTLRGALCALALAMAPVTAAAQTPQAIQNPVKVSSPDGRIAVEIGVDKDQPVYAVSFRGKTVFRPSKLGFVLKDGPSLAEGFKVADVQRRRFDQTWIQPWGEEREIREKYNELVVQFRETAGPERRLTVIFRVFNDGFGFRYEIPAQPNVKDIRIIDEATEFSFVQNLKTWWIRAYQDNDFEYQYAASALDALDVVYTPVTMEGEGIAVSIHEAALVDFAGMALKRPTKHGTTLKADLVPWADGVKVYGTAPMRSPWRTVQIADKPHELLNSRLILNLNEPSKIADTSWIKPGKYMGIWWCMHIRTCTWEPGPQQGATTANAKRYIDFAAANGFPSLLIEGWNVGWEADWFEDGSSFRFAEPVKGFDIAEVVAYGKSKGVSLIGHHETSANIKNYESQMEAAYAYYAKLGVPAVKTGYVGRRLDRKEWHQGQYMVRHFEKVMALAAKQRIMLNAHEPIKDTGLRRTWPHMMTREGARGQEYDAWGPSEDGNLPDHTTILPFTRLLAGPMDYTPGIFSLRYPNGNGNSTTLAKQLAMYVVLYSPLQMAADLPENYQGQPAFKFIRDVPTDWDRSIAVNGKIGDYVTFVRKDRASESWYLGAVTDEEARTLSVPLTFLTPGRRYVAEIYADGADAHWLNNPHAVDIRAVSVTAADTLEIRMAPGGGQAVRFVPQQ